MNSDQEAAQRAKDDAAGAMQPSPEEREKQVMRERVTLDLSQLTPTVEILQFFQFAHLPPRLSGISMMFAGTAVGLVKLVPDNAERSVALRKLLEAKDAAVRARLNQ